MLRQAVEIEIDIRSSAVPGVPENHPLAVGSDGGDGIGRGGGDTQALIGAGVLGQQFIVRAEADDRSVLGRQQEPGIAEPGQNGCGADSAGVAARSRGGS